jgi:hypothetical protein
LAPCSCDVVAVGGVLELYGRTAVGAIGSLLISPCFCKSLRAAVVMEHEGCHHYLFTGASQMGRRSCSPCDVAGPSPRSGEAEAPPRSRSSLGPRVGRGGDRRPRSRLSLSPGVGRGGDRRSRLMLSLSPGVGRGGVHLPRPRLSPSPGVGRGGVHLPRSRLSPSPGAERGGVRLPRSRLSPSPGVGRGGVRLPRSRLSPSPRVGRGGASYGARGWT